MEYNNASIIKKNDLRVFKNSIQFIVSWIDCNIVLDKLSTVVMKILNANKKALFIVFPILIIILIFGLNFANSTFHQNYQVWLTSPSDSILFKKVTGKFKKVTGKYAVASSFDELPVIEIESDKVFQEMDGFGYTLTGGSARLLNEMSKDKRIEILNELFGTTTRDIGVSYLRLSIGASDLSDSVFSYNDIPSGETDKELRHFNMDMEKVHLIPVLKEILAINPAIKIMGSPWSAPAWMKDNNSAIGGSLMIEYFDVYAQYFVKYIHEMKSEGINIDAITIQNEPLHPGNNPSMYMTPGHQALFIKESLGPAFKQAGIRTKIVIYDHNADRIDYPLTVLKDPAANIFIDGTAFHLYGGTIDALSELHDAYPDKNIYFTEQWIGAPGNLQEDLVWHTENLIIGATRNWCKNVLEWNLAADKNQQPHTDRGGCTRCLGAITIDGDSIVRNPAYYIIAHASKFVRPGSYRIGSGQNENLLNVAFKTPENNIVLIVLNKASKTQQFEVHLNGKPTITSLQGGAVATYIFSI